MDLAKVLVQFGPALAWLLMLASLAAAAVAARRGRGLFPRGAAGWSVWFVAALLVAICVLFLGVVNRKIAPLASVYGAQDQYAAAFQYMDLEQGATHALSDYRGKVVVLNLWATWCGPCRRELPELEQIQQRYAAQGVVVVLVSDESVAALQRYPGLANMHVVQGRRDSSLAASPLFVAGGVARPVTHIIDRKGVLRETLVGGQALSAFEAKLRPYL